MHENTQYLRFIIGKLRHFLLGSPSGYSWTEQVPSHISSNILFKVETILTHEDGWRRWDRIPTDIKMLPRYKRAALLEAKRRNALLGDGELMPRIEKGEKQKRIEEEEGGMAPELI